MLAWLNTYFILGYGESLPVFLIPWEISCPTQGWQCCWEIKEHASLWLGGMLQQQSWLWDELLSKISTRVYLSSVTVFAYELLWNYHEHVECMNVLNEWFASDIHISCPFHYASVYLYIFIKCIELKAYKYIDA